MLCVYIEFRHYKYVCSPTLFMSYAALTGDKILTPDDIERILEEILPAMNRSRYIGMALKIPEHIIQTIHDRYEDPQDRLSYILLEFLRQVEPRPTWRAIVDALKSPLVNCTYLAQEVEKSYCPPSSAQCGVQGEL